MSVRTSTAMIALSALVAFGCNDDVSGPADEPPGELEVSVAVTGTSDAPDRYAVRVSIEGVEEVSSRVVDSRGGTARFPDLPPGDYSARLESLAADCSVEGTNPRRFAVLGGETSRIEFTISCPGPAALEVSVGVTGIPPDPDGHTVVVAAERGGVASSAGVKSVGGTARIANLPPGEYSVGLESLGDNCSVKGENPRDVTARADRTSLVNFAVFCSGSVTGIFERVNPPSANRFSRYVIEEDGTFRLEYWSAGSGHLFDYEGTWTVGTAEFIFEFEGISATRGPDGPEVPGRAFGTVGGDCITIEYNIVMWLSDFRGGEYCRLPGT